MPFYYSIFTRAERALAWLPRESAALAGDYQACMGPQGERYQEEERQRSREAATWTHRVCQASVTIKSILAHWSWWPTHSDSDDAG